MRSDNNRMVTEMFANFPFFLLEYMFPATELAWQNSPDIHFMKTTEKLLQ